MDSLTIRDRVFEEIELIPETKLGDVFDLVRTFRMGLDENEDTVGRIMSLAGSWGDMPEDDFRKLSKELEERRESTSSRRRSAAGLD